ncbi:glycosyltransferase [Microaerobacter geothermalis]|uniref:glycosyltransferase family 2 protein n=1 Tax=Microaerobacter geothermalis TaxID=674972 RepID=UPI001F1B844F|nr:glycosyltransferase family 2 protein [Microaerobacter geothermalis]MCF6093323.1 glycosyltransferase [Microaerobacter geothermalis]
MFPSITIGLFVDKKNKPFDYFISSVLQQSFQDWEMFIFSDSVKKGDFETSDKRIFWYPVQSESGRSDWKKALIHLSRGEYILLLSPSVEIYPYAFSSLLETIRMNQSDLLISSGFPFPYVTEGWERVGVEDWLKQRIKILNEWSPLSLILWRKTILEKINLKSFIVESLLSVPKNVKMELLPVMLCHKQFYDSSMQWEAIWPLKKTGLARFLKKYGLLHSFSFNNQYYVIHPRKNDSEISTMPKVSVLSSVYNEEENLYRMLESLELQTYRNMEIILINDGSTDGTDQIITQFIRSCGKKVCYISRAENVGKGKSMNEGLQLAEGKYLLEVDGDDWLDPECVEVYVSIMEETEPEVAYLYGDRRVFRKGQFVPLRYSGLSKGYPIKDRLFFLSQLRPHGPRFLRAEAVRKIGGWPTDYPSEGRLYEDFAILLRLIETYKFSYIPGAYYNIYRIGRNKKKPYWTIILPIIFQALHRWDICGTFTINKQEKKITFYQSGNRIKQFERN